MPSHPTTPSPHPPADAPATPGLSVCLVELLFLVAVVVAERWLARGALKETWLARSPLRYAGFLAVATIGAYWALIALVLRADFEAVLERASLAMGTLAAVLVPYAWAHNPLWILPALAVAACFYLREFRADLMSPRTNASAESAGMAPAAWDDLHALGRDHGLASMNLLVVDPSRGTGKALAEYRPTTPEPTFVFTRAMVDLLDPAEMRAVFAHELAHHRLDHSRKALAAVLARRLAGAGLVVAALQAAGPSPGAWEAVLAAPAVMLAWYLTQVLLYPIHCACQRRQERQAHRLALEMTKDPAAFVSALRKIAAHNGYGNGPSKLQTWLFEENLPLADALALGRQG